MLHDLVADHVVQDCLIFPGAGYLEMARAADGSMALRGVYFLQPLALEAAGLYVDCAVSDNHFEVRSSDAIEGVTAYCSGATASAAVLQRIDHASLRAPAIGAVDSPHKSPTGC